MARIQSPVWNIARGSIAGTTYFANQFHQIVARARTAPIVPLTSYTTAIKTAMSGAAAMWNALLQAERDGWNDYAQTVVYTGPFGQYKLPGRQIFIANQVLEQYMNFFSAGMVTPGIAPPSIAGWLTMATINAVPTTNPNTGVAVSIVNNSGEDAVCLAQRSLAFNPARMQYKGPWSNRDTVIEDVLDGGGTVIEFNNLYLGQAYFMNVRLITEAPPHRITEQFIVRGVATAPGP